MMAQQLFEFFLIFDNENHNSKYVSLVDFHWLLVDQLHGGHCQTPSIPPIC